MITYCPTCGFKHSYQGVKPRQCEACDEPFESVVTKVKPTKSGQAAPKSDFNPPQPRRQPAGPRRMPREGDDPQFQAAVEAAVAAQLQRRDRGLSRRQHDDDVASDNDFDLSEITGFDGIKLVASESQLGSKTTTDKLKDSSVSFERTSPAESPGVAGVPSTASLKGQIIQEMLKPVNR